MNREGYSVETLNILGYRGQAVPHAFFRQQQETRHIAIKFPGFSYTAHMPVMYYPGRLLVARGADVLSIEYHYGQRPDFQTLSKAEREHRLYADVSAAYDAALAQRAYERLTLVGKSLGTLAMGYLLTSRTPLPQTQCVWLTPLLKNEALRTRIRQIKHRALFVIGTADPHYDRSWLAEVEQATGGESLVIDGADHSLEIAGDVVQSIRTVQQVIERIQQFLG